MYPLLDSAGVPRDSVQWLGRRRARAPAGLARRPGEGRPAERRLRDAGRERSEHQAHQVGRRHPAGLSGRVAGSAQGHDGREPRGGDRDHAGRDPGLPLHRAKQGGTIEVVLKYTPGMDKAVLNRAYDELMRIKGFGVNGGMTEANLKVRTIWRSRTARSTARSARPMGRFPVSAARDGFAGPVHRMKDWIVRLFEYRVLARPCSKADRQSMSALPGIWRACSCRCGGLPTGLTCRPC